MRARGRGMTWWARTAQKSGSRLLPNAAVPVWWRKPSRSEPWLRTKIWLCEHRARLKCSIVALYGVARVQESACRIVAVPRGGRRALTSGEKVGFNVLWSFLLIYI